MNPSMMADASPLMRFRVEDRSMEPTFHADDFVLVNRWAYLLRGPRRGDVVVLRDPEAPLGFLLKRVGSTAEGGKVSVHGDNAQDSRDSRHFGAVDAGLVVGKVWFHAKG